MPAAVPRPPEGNRSAPTGALLVGAVAVLAVLASGVGGPWTTTKRFGDLTDLQGAERSALPSPSSPLQPPAPAAAADPPALLVVAFWAVFVVVGMALVVFLVRQLRDWTPPDRKPGRDLRPGPVAVVTVEPAMPALRHGAAAALAALDDRRGEPRDAVIAAWLALQEAAAEAGVERTPADTPTEFTAKVLTAALADAAPVRVLMRLYHRARFSSAPLTPVDLDEARRALSRIVESWAVDGKPSP